MNKSNLILELAKKHNLIEKDATQIVDLVFDDFTDTLRNGGRIEIREFGSFVIWKYGAYTGRNPRTGNKVDVKPKKLPFFKAGRKLKK
jgi:integration host factor subunit beta